MSVSQKPTNESDDPARVQPWFAVMAASMVPAMVSFALPDVVSTAALVLSVVLFAAACAMLYRQTRSSS